MTDSTRRRFSATRLALNYVVLSLFVLAMIATPLWYAWREVIDEGRTQILVADKDRLAQTFTQNGLAALMIAIDSRTQGQPDNDEKYFLLADQRFRFLAGNLQAWPSALPPSRKPLKLDIFDDGQPRRAVLVGTTLPGGYHLLVGRNTAYHQKLEGMFLVVMLIATVLILLLGAFSGLLIRRTLLFEIDTVNKTTAAIVKGDLTRRLPVRHGTDELNLLAQTVNQMLDQIEQLIHGIRNTSNAIAHDLRTPLTELRFVLENLTLHRPPPEQTFAEIDTAVADVDRVIAIFNALLRLAEIDTGARRSGFVDIDLARIAEDVAEFYQPVAELKQVSLHCNAVAPLPYRGDPVLLAQALSNLIDNALKYVPEGGALVVSAYAHTTGTLRVSVADNGPGIAASDLPHVTERFYRTDSSRGTPGVGLGLSLVAAVATLHNGQLALLDNQPGLRVQLELPPALKS